MEIRVPLRLKVDKTFRDAEDLKIIAKSSLKELLIKKDIMSSNTVCRIELGDTVSHYADGGRISDNIGHINTIFSNMEFDPSFYREPRNPYDPLAEDEDTRIEIDLFVTKAGQCIGRCTSQGTTGFLKVKGNENGRHRAISFGIKETGDVLSAIRKGCRL